VTLKEQKMLSFIYRLASDFEREHGYPPNVLYISQAHLSRLRHDFSNPADLTAINNFLEMELIMRNDALHPHVGWIHTAQVSVAQAG